MILIGLGANLPSPEHGAPQATLAAALDALAARGATALRRSPWYESAPAPPSGQPWYVNAAAEVESALSPQALLAALLDVEAGFGRVRGPRNASRTVDLDLLDYRGLVTGPGEKPELPHSPASMSAPSCCCRSATWRPAGAIPPPAARWRR